MHYWLAHTEPQGMHAVTSNAAPGEAAAIEKLARAEPGWEPMFSVKKARIWPQTRPEPPGSALLACHIAVKWSAAVSEQEKTLSKRSRAMNSWLLVGVYLLQGVTTDADPGLFVKALQVAQAYGISDSTGPAQDRQVKATLAKAVANDQAISLDEVQKLFAPNVFAELAGEDSLLKADEIQRALEASVPNSRQRLKPQLREHAQYLTTTFDMLSESQLEASRQLAEWLAARYDSQESVHVIVICTGNSRRSMFGACMGNMAAAYSGMERVHFHSGGTTPTAFNRRTIHSLKEIGFEIEPTGEEATRGEPKTANPKYTVRWGQGLDALEYSKKFSEPGNPATGFAAVMVCTEADSDCPLVRGAALRLPLPFLDPKSYDDSKYETAKYAERRDDIGRVMLATMAMASRQLQEKPRPQ